MKIALIHHPIGHKQFSENPRVVDEDFCLAPPIILAYVAAILEREGHTVVLIDANALKYNKEKVLGILKAISPDVIGFRADTYWFHRVVEWATYFKDRMDVKVVVGGINVTLYPAESLAYPCFDYGIAGEANISFPRLLTALRSGASISGIKGIIYRKDGEVIVNRPQDQAVNFDDYPFPARHLLPNHLYHSFTSQQKNFTVMLTATGCPYRCSFCAIAKLPFRQREPGRVIDEIEECYKKHGVREIDFFDATFFIGRERSLAICDGISKRGLKIAWSCRSRVDVVDEEVLNKAREAGCRKIYYGIESASDEVLNNIHKDISRDQIARAIDLTHRCGIDTLGFFMVGNPGDTPDRILETIRFAKRLKLDFIQVCRAIPKPGTELNDRILEEGGGDYWREYISGKKAEARLSSPGCGLSEEALDALVFKFYKDFYFRLSYMAKRILKVRTKKELFRYARTALRWFFANGR